MITFEEVKTFAEKRDTENGTVGKCGNATRCLVAEAILDKYPNVTHVRVGWTGEHDVDLGVLTTEEANPDRLFDSDAAKWVGDHNDPEVFKLIKLIKAFDRLGWSGEVPASVVLPLFEDQQQDTGFNAYEDVPADEDEDDDLPFDDDEEDEDEIFDAYDPIYEYDDEDWEGEFDEDEE